MLVLVVNLLALFIFLKNFISSFVEKQMQTILKYMFSIKLVNFLSFYYRKKDLDILLNALLIVNSAKACW